MPGVRLAVFHVPRAPEATGVVLWLISVQFEGPRPLPNSRRYEAKFGDAAIPAMATAAPTVSPLAGERMIAGNVELMPGLAPPSPGVPGSPGVTPGMRPFAGPVSVGAMGMPS